MKRLFDNRFLLIIIMCLVVMIGLTISALYLFDDSDASFVKSGYVINPLSENVTKYYFNENTEYKVNLQSMIEFVDIDKNKVDILQDSFIHYSDDSISFLKKGAILDLDSISGNNAVKFYNISNKSIVNKSNNGYTIDSINDKIELKNFIGRINEDKYIVVGKVELKIPGNETLIKGDYFEFVFPKLGVVNIENKDSKFQVTQQDTYFYLDNGIVIDLGKKSIIKNDTDIMSITEIIIDGNENIEIIPKDEKEGNKEQNNDTDNIKNEIPNNDKENDKENSDGNGNGSGDKEQNNIEEDKKELSIEIKKTYIGSTNIDVTFSIINKQDNDKLNLQVISMNTGRTVEVIEEIQDEVEYRINLLSPKTKYLFTVINKKDDSKNLQKIFETSGFGIKLEKSYVTDSKLAYKVIVDDDTDITDATLSLYKFNEETNKNEIVKTSYYDAATGETKYVEKIVKLSTLKDNLDKEYEIVFDNLDSNTIYTAVLDEFSTVTANYKDIYNINLTSMTLKKTPNFSDMRAKKDISKSSFELSLGKIDDPDNAIVSYTYLIYDNNTKKIAIPEIKKTNASLIKVNIGQNDNELKSDTNYYYKVIIEYFDNEKYIEYITTDSINFMMGSDPYVTVVPNESLISYNKIGATIYIKDNSCLVSIPGREKCDGDSSTIVTVRKINSLTGDFESNAIYSETVDFKIENGEIKYDFELDGLQAGSTYNIEVKALLNDREDGKYVELEHTEDSKRNITTKTLKNFIMEWSDKGSSVNHAINLDAQLIADEKTGSLSSVESAKAIEKVVLKLYEGNHITDIDTKKYIALKTFTNSADFNIKEEFYDKKYNITNDETFGLSIEQLKELNENNKLCEYYTIMIEAYYDDKNVEQVILSNNITSYLISPILLLENISDPELKITNITNKESAKIFKELNNDGTVVGYDILAIFPGSELIDNNLIPKKINFYVYDKDNRKVKFYIKDDNDKLVVVDEISRELSDAEYYNVKIYMDYGTDYYNIDDIMSRGNEYHIGYTINLLDNVTKKDVLYPNNKDSNEPSDYGLWNTKIEVKETPKIKMYIANSTNNAITYNYLINDPDKALYKEKDSQNYSMYYKINNGDEVKKDITLSDDISNNKLVISGLKNEGIYSFYYKKNSTKTGDISKDVANFLGDSQEIDKVFDGYYDLKNDSNFIFNVISDQLLDNKVTIKFGRENDADDTIKMLDRIMSYKLTFTDGTNKLEKELWKLEECSDGSVRCLSVDYLELKNASMKSTKDDIKNIKVSVKAIYDNGLIGYDFADMEKYPYMILQKNQISNEREYISFRNSGQLAIFDNTDFPKGYYTYSLKGNNLFYNSKHSNKNTTILVALGSNGYNSSLGAVTPKMVSVDEFKSNNNTFSFSSITPKVKTSNVTSLLNGAVVDVKLSGIDLTEILNEGSNASPKYYIYIDTWRDIPESDMGQTNIARPTVKALINNDNPNETIQTYIDGLENGMDNNKFNYKYRVYACIYRGGQVNDSRCKNGYSYTQLFDSTITSKNETKTYSFTPLVAFDVFQNKTVSYQLNDEKYGNKELSTKINLIPYKKEIPFNFDIIYMVCEVGDTDCGLDKNNIFTKKIDSSNVKNNIIDIVDITKYDLEHDKNYYMYIYAIVDKYVLSDGKFKNEEANILLNRYSLTFKLNKLVEPTFAVTREALITDDGKYAIDFGITVNDPDRTLINGSYYIKLEKVVRNESENVIKELSGTLQVLDKNMNYITIDNYSDYSFDALIPNNKIRITNLDSDTEYRFTVYSSAYINNYSDTVIKEDRKYEVSKYHTVATATDYGVAIGKNITYSVTEKSIVVTFLGGSKFDNVKKVNYTIGLWDATADMTSYSGEDVIGENNKYFQIDKEHGEWSYVLAPNGMVNKLNQSFKVKVTLVVLAPNGEERIVELPDATTAYKE